MSLRSKSSSRFLLSAFEGGVVEYCSKCTDNCIIIVNLNIIYLLTAVKTNVPRSSLREYLIYKIQHVIQ